MSYYMVKCTSSRFSIRSSECCFLIKDRKELIRFLDFFYDCNLIEPGKFLTDIIYFKDNDFSYPVLKPVIKEWTRKHNKKSLRGIRNV